MRLALAFVLLAGCGDDGPAPGKVVRVGGETYRTGQRIQVDVGEHEKFHHRYRFHAERGEVVSIQAETGGAVLDVAIAPVGEHAEWKRGPRAEIREQFRAGEAGTYELEVRGDSLTFGNTYRLVVGQR